MLFGPPPSGFYQYLNEKLIIKQYQALQNDMEPKQKTETIGKEHSVSAAVALTGASLGAGARGSDEHSTTFGVPEISAPFAAGQLIKRFMTENECTPMDNVRGYTQSVYLLVGLRGQYAQRNGRSAFKPAASTAQNPCKVACRICHRAGYPAKSSSLHRKTSFQESSKR